MTAHTRLLSHRWRGDHDQGDNWQAEAVCRQVDPELFFPIGTGPSAQVQEAAAVRVCRGCPVREACLVGALREGDDHSVRGGMTAGQRRRFQMVDGRVVLKPSGFRCRRCEGPLPDGSTGNTKYCPSCRLQPGPKVTP